MVDTVRNDPGGGGAHAIGASFTDDEMAVQLADGRTIIVPLIWFPRLAKATRAELERYEILVDGEGLHWPSLNEDLSVAGLLRGAH